MHTWNNKDKENQKASHNVELEIHDDCCNVDNKGVTIIYKKALMYSEHSKDC